MIRLNFILSLLCLSMYVHAQEVRIEDNLLADIINEYKYLHQNPELSFLEKETSARLANQMRDYGYTVTENIGGYGVVCVLKNGPGKTILLRADTDALPVKEKNDLPYRSTRVMKDITGEEVPVMHACGHDIHMSVWLGSARYLVEHKNLWSGTLVMIAQPAEERSGGAKNMIKDGLFRDFPIPDYALALHVNATLPAGKIGWKTEYALANVDMMDITVKGRGGHGAYPHTTQDPVTIAAKLILDLQTIVSREISPLNSAVVTVGAIHGGNKGNVIPDDVKLQLTLRSYTDEVRQKILSAIERKCKAAGVSAGLEEKDYPIIELRDEFTPALYNNIELTRSVVQSFYKAIGEDNVVRVPAVMGGEDFGQYGRTEEKIPIFMYWLGAVSQEQYDYSIENGIQLPSLHNSGFIPDPEPTIKTGIISMTQAVIDLLK